MSESEFVLKILQPVQWQEILKFVNLNFGPYEALERGLHATTEDLSDFHEEVVKEWLQSGVSVSVFHEPSQSLAGICLNQILTRQIPTAMDIGKDVNEKTRLLRSILYQFETEINVFDDQNIDKVLEPTLMTVDKKFSGKGISYKLLQESEILGKKEGCQLSFTQATGLGSKHIFTKCGYEILKEINYEDIRIDGKNPFDVAAMLGSKSCIIIKKKLNTSTDK